MSATNHLLVLFGTTIIMYINSVLSSVFIHLALTSLCSNLHSLGLFNFSTLPLHDIRDKIPHSLRIATLELASNNLICSVALTGVLALQAGRSWAERTEEGDDEEFVFVEPDGTPVEVTVPPTGVLANNGIRRSRGKTPEIGLSEDKVKPLRVQAS
jgi:hypothetical protein